MSLTECEWNPPPGAEIHVEYGLPEVDPGREIVEMHPIGGSLFSGFSYREHRRPTYRRKAVEWYLDDRGRTVGRNLGWEKY